MNGAELLLGAAVLARRAERTALVYADERVSAAALAARVRRSAGAYLAHGIVPRDRVLLLMRDTPEAAAAWLGAVHVGAVAIALNGRLPEADYGHILADSQAKLVLVEEHFASARPDLTAELAAQKRVAVAGDAAPPGAAWRAWLEAAAEAAPCVAGPDDPAFGLYSSGTTGRPKGIVHEHKVFLHLGKAFDAFGLQAGETVLATSRLFFAYGMEHALLAPLAKGLTSILCPDSPDTAAVVELVERHRPAAVFSVPTVYRRLLAEPRARLAAFGAVRRCVAAGERLSVKLVEQWRAAAGGELLNLYGMSETFCACIVTPPRSSDGVRTGLPLAGVEIRLRDAHEREPQPGQPGVLWVRHPAQAGGYANLPEQTRAQFRDGWFCSRDLFVRDAAGYLVHQGRSDELVKVAGQWVQPGELEEAAALDPAVAEVACVPVVDEDGLERLALFVAARGDEAEAVRAAAAACERALPRYKRPKWVRAIAELPRTATGKVQRYKLRELLERELAGKA
ncbi:MAG: AMP-binding protein [Betaproteobacteria bacterium]